MLPPSDFNLYVLVDIFEIYVFLHEVFTDCVLIFGQLTQIELPGKREPQLRNCLLQIGPRAHL